MIITKSTLEARRHRLHTLSNNNVTIAFLLLQNIAIDPWKFLWTNINQKVCQTKGNQTPVEVCCRGQELRVNRN